MVEHTTNRVTASRSVLLAVGILLAGGGLAACSSGSGSQAGGPDSTVTPGAAPATSAGASDALGYGTGSSAVGTGSPGTSTDLATGTNPLGTIVVDGQGMTVYFFDKDTRGAPTSSCTADCAAAWPAVHTSVGAPTVDGVTGKVGEITGVDGKKQVTLDGRPLYTYAGDAKPGDTAGQGIGGVWWLVSPAGDEIGR